MKVLFIYRNSNMGFSIGKVFRPIEKTMRMYCDVDSIYMPVPNYGPMGLWKNIRCAINAVKKTHYDIVHITGTENYLIPFLKRQNTVVTVHDLGFYTELPRSLRTIGKNILFIKTLKYASRVTFISEKSQAEGEKLVNFKEGQICTIHDPFGEEFKYVHKKLNTEYPTVLHIGTKLNKNLNNTIVALKDFPHHLRIIGKLNETNKNLLKSYHTDYSNAYNLTDEEIREEYEKCDIVNFPSLYEGFGVPILEGQAVGRVVITSNLSPMKEIAGNGAVLVDPTDVNSILKGYQTAINNYETYVKAGLENVSRFELMKITKEYYDLYNNLLQSELSK